MICNGKNGYLVGIGDVKAMLEYAKKLLEDKKLRLECGKCGRKFAEKYSFEVIREELKKIYGNRYE